MLTIEELKAIQERIAPGKWCPYYCYSAIRHVVRNCDIECMETGHELGNPSCKHFDRGDGTDIALFPELLFRLIEAEEELVTLRQDVKAAYERGRDFPDGK